MCFKTFSKDVCKSWYNKLNKLRILRHFLLQDLKIMLVKYIVISKSEFCNCFHLYTPQYVSNKMKKVFNACISFIFNIPMYTV